MNQADGAVFREDVDPDDPDNVRIVYVIGGREFVREVHRPGTPHKPLLEGLAALQKRLGTKVESIRAYCGETLLEERTLV